MRLLYATIPSVTPPARYSAGSFSHTGSRPTQRMLPCVLIASATRSLHVIPALISRSSSQLFASRSSIAYPPRRGYLMRSSQASLLHDLVVLLYDKLTLPDI